MNANTTTPKPSTGDLHPESPVLLRFKNLRKAFGGQTVLGGVSGEIRQGEVILLHGGNGSGKTTLLNILTGCLEPDSGSIEYSALPASHSPSNIPQTSFHFPRPWHADLNPFQQFTPERIARLGIGRTWQDVRLFGSLDLADNIAAAAPDASDSPWSALVRPRHSAKTNRLNRQAAARTLATLGFSEREHSSADKISLGQSKRVAIARAISADARVLFLDEPLAGLDAEGILNVLAHLQTLASDFGLSLVIVEHELNIPKLLDFTTKIWTLTSGAITCSPPAMNDREHRSAKSAKSVHELIRHAIGRNMYVTEQRLPQNAILTTYWLSTTDDRSNPRYTLEVSDLAIRRGTRCIFPDGISFRLPELTISVLEAPNGWGKSTLVAAIAGFIPGLSGQVTVDSNQIPSQPWSRVRAGIATCPSADKLFSNLNRPEHDRLAGTNPSNRNTPPQGELTATQSGGQKQSLLLDIFTSSRKRVAILDEPFSHLDQTETTRQIKRVLNSASSVLILIPASFT